MVELVNSTHILRCSLYTDHTRPYSIISKVGWPDSNDYAIHQTVELSKDIQPDCTYLCLLASRVLRLILHSEGFLGLKGARR